MVGKVSSKAVDYKWNHSDPTVRSQEISPRRHEWPPAFSAHYQASLRVSPHHLRRPPAGVLWTSWAGACSSPASGRRWTTKTGCGCCWEEKKEKKKEKERRKRGWSWGGRNWGTVANEELKVSQFWLATNIYMYIYKLKLNVQNVSTYSREIPRKPSSFYWFLQELVEMSTKMDEIGKNSVREMTGRKIREKGRRG